MAENRFEKTKYLSRQNLLDRGVKCVFISHQQNDKLSARKIADYLINSGIDVYFDAYDKDLKIHHQSNNAKAVTNSIKKGINNSSHMLVLVSPNTLISTWVPFEIGYGHDKTDLFVLCLKGIKKGELPEYVRTANVIRDIRDMDKFILNNLDRRMVHLFESQKQFSLSNPLSTVMDTVIDDKY